MTTNSGSQTLRLLAAYRATGDSSARDRLVVSYLPLVRKICGRFRASPGLEEDLVQVGAIGLMKAIERFDPQYGTSFSSLAIPHILGAVLNYFRDHGNLLKVPRALRQRKVAVDKASERLALRLGRWPTVFELARECDLTEDEVQSALDLVRTGEPGSLDIDSGGGDGGFTPSDLLGPEDEGFRNSLDRVSLAEALDTLPAREKTIMSLRYSTVGCPSVESRTVSASPRCRSHAWSAVP